MENSTTHILDEAVIEKIKSLKLSRKKITINDVADLSNVSKKTVSRIINDSPNVKKETRELVDAIINELSFKPNPQARALAFRSSFLVGLIYDNPNPQYVVNMQLGVLDGLKGTGKELVVHPCDKKSPDFLSEIEEFVVLQRLSGVIILPPLAEDRALLKLLDSLEVNYVRVSARKGEANDPPIIASEIVSNDRIGCSFASSLLAEYGHEKIGFIGGDLIYPSAIERRIGFLDGLSKNNISLEQELDVDGDYRFETGYKQALKILKRQDRPTAIIACNDEMAAGVYKAAYELGINIPNELSVVAFDDSPLAERLSPSLSSVRLPTVEMGKKAAELVLSPSINTQTFIFESKLMQRTSIKRIN